ncbi:MAG TPA: aspartate aminotransferase family protein [Chloroflexota bacterium]|nr:aspartate aminotransferase family protein [Chloroflexota bacterium]
MLMESELVGTELPSVRTEVPGPRSLELAGRLAEHESPAASGVSVGERPVFWDQTRGATVVDVDGNRYVDLTAGFCVAVAGHSNPRIVAAIAQQAARMLHGQGVMNPNEPRVKLVEKLASLTPGDLSVAHVVTTGGEAVETALKTARLHTGRQTVVAFQGAFHGKIGGALAATSQTFYREPFVGVLPGVVHVPYPDEYRNPFGEGVGDPGALCANYLERVLTHPDSGVCDVAAVIMEPVQGHGGWIVPPVQFVQRVREICSKRGILLIADEIITGFGRTGEWFALNRAGVVPDILVCGKGMASGFPISAMITRPEIARSWHAYQQSTTFLGNPVAAAAALASIAEVEERGLVERSRSEGAYFKSRLEALAPRHPLVGNVRGIGLMVAIELVKDRQTKEPAPDETKMAVAALLRRGIMCTNSGGAYHNVLKMSPPLVITREQLDCAIDAIDASLSDVEARHEG